MAREEAQTVMLEDAKLIFRNFAGKEDQYNKEGNKNFAVLLDDATAEMLLNDGWNVKYLKAREEGDEPQPYLPVGVRFDIMPPTIVMITSSGRARLDDDSVAVLDWANILTVDLIVRAYTWAVGDKSGTKGYLKSMYVTIEEDELEKKYAIPPEPHE
jgi:hypothetical protein